jgi:aspartate/methionine/tyrosine aminotransferase
VTQKPRRTVYSNTAQVHWKRDEILIPNPGWANYVPISRISGARSVGYPLFEKDDFNVNIDNVRKLITPKTKMILINSPSNPSGGVIQEDDFTPLGEH